jgi:hypothetical protein
MILAYEGASMIPHNARLLTDTEGAKGAATMKYLIPLTFDATVTIPVGMWYFSCCQEDLRQSQGEAVESMLVDHYYDTKNEALDALITDWQRSASTLGAERAARAIAACEAMKEPE